MVAIIASDAVAIDIFCHGILDQVIETAVSLPCSAFRSNAEIRCNISEQYAGSHCRQIAGFKKDLINNNVINLIIISDKGHCKAHKR